MVPNCGAAHKEQVEVSLNQYSLVSLAFNSEEYPYRTEPCKDQIDGVVDGLHHQHSLACQAMTRAQNLPSMSDGIRCGKERAVQPSAPLNDKLRKSVWNIRLADRALDILENPGASLDGRVCILTED
jgi:hypothetical protein